MIIKIGVIPYNVGEDINLAEDSFAGQIRYQRQEIVTMPGFPPLVRMQVLWHEVIHGVLKNAGIHETDERIVDALSYGILQVLRENPELVKMTVAE